MKSGLTIDNRDLHVMCNLMEDRIQALRLAITEQNAKIALLEEREERYLCEISRLERLLAMKEKM